MQRLKTRAQFQAALAGGTIARTPHFALHRCSLEPRSGGDAVAALPNARTPISLFQPEAVWIGAMVPKRWARRAVTRNTIKRLIYVASAGAEATFEPAAHVVRLRAGFDRKVFVSATSDRLKLAVRAELDQLFQRAARPLGGVAGPARPTLPGAAAGQSCSSGEPRS
ncbi:MAG: ribonuclease P protein component [Comamonadaceae bacterium]|nr:MAG: ribonuclease P protein component [Comamonadaceae bacterium]